MIEQYIIIDGTAPPFIIFAVLFTSAFAFSRILPEFEKIPRGSVFKKIAKWLSILIVIPPIIGFFMIAYRIMINKAINYLYVYDFIIILIMVYSFCSIFLYGLFDFIYLRKYKISED